MQRRLIGILITVAFLTQSTAFVARWSDIQVTPTVLASTSPEKKTAAKADSATRMRVSEAYGKLPLSFEQNRGQADGQVKFLSRGANYALLLTQTEAVLSLLSKRPGATSQDTGSADSELQSAILRRDALRWTRSAFRPSSSPSTPAGSAVSSGSRRRATSSRTSTRRSPSRPAARRFSRGSSKEPR